MFSTVNYQRLFIFACLVFLGTLCKAQCSNVTIIDFTADGSCPVGCGSLPGCVTTTVTVSNSDTYCCEGTNNTNSSRCKMLVINTPSSDASCFDITATPQDNGANWWMVDDSDGLCYSDPSVIYPLNGGTSINFQVYDEGGPIELVVCKQGTGDIDIELCAIPCCTINSISIPDESYLCYENVPEPVTTDDFLALGGIIDAIDATGNGCANMEFSYIDSAIPSQICTDRIFTRTYTVCFCGSQNFTFDQIITISADNLPPELEIGGSTTDFPVQDLGCLSAPPTLPLELSVTGITDDCSPIDPSEVVITDDYPGIEDPSCFYTITRTYSISDACDAVAEVTETFTYSLNANGPEFPTGPADITITCLSELGAAPDLDWTDDCDGTGTVPATETIGTMDDCTGGIVSREWEYTDACGLTGTFIQQITVEPITSLTFLNPPSDVTIFCGESAPPIVDLDYTNSAIDPSCETAGTISPVESGSLNSCGDQLTRTYEFTSTCGVTINHVQTITLTDNTSPVIDNPPADITVDCYSDIPVMPTVTWTDDCDGNGDTAAIELGTIDNCSQSVIERTFSYTDNCNNLASHTQYITIEPIPDIIWTSPLPADVTIDCNDAIPSGLDLDYSNGASNPDCLNEGTVSYVDSGSLSVCGDQITRTWSVDADPSSCINALTHSITITLNDNDPPIFVNLPSASANVSCVSDIPTSQDLEWLDDCDGAGVVGYTDSGSPDACNGGSITRTWSHTDACGNGPIEFSMIYIIEAPLFTSCDDGDPCTDNDMEKLDCDGGVCVPCAGVPTDCNGLLTTVSCDDGDPCTENDEQEVACDGTICVPCAGVPVATCSGVAPNVTLPCDDGDPCTINDEYQVDGCDLMTECVPCAGTLSPTPDPTPNPTNLACMDETTILNVAGCSGTLTWYDAVGGAVLFVGNDFVTPVITNDISFWVTCTVNGCESNPVEVVVTVTSATLPNITGPDLLCTGQETITLTADAGYSTYDWGSGPGTDQSLSVSDAGTYGVTVTDVNGCVASTSYTVNAAPLPDVAIAGSTTFCTGGSTTLNVPPDYVNYNWAPGGESSDAITINAAGTYSVTVTDVNGCTGSADITVSIADNLVPQITGDLSFCAGGTTDISVGSGYTSINWGPGGESTESISVSAAGTYTVTVTDSDGCSGTASVDIIENQNPTPNISGSTGICNGGTELLTADAGFDSYIWSDGSINQDLSITADGTYGVTVTDANGCTGEASITVALIPDLVVDITGDDMLCPGGSDQVTVSATAGFSSYEWSNAGSTNEDLIINAVGTYTVTVTDANGCTGTNSITITEDTPPTVNIDGNLTFCSGFSTTLSATAGFTSYDWSTAETTSLIDVNVSGTYSVTVTDTDGCTNTAEITITELSQLEPTMLGELDICPGGNEEVTLSVQGSYDSYDWGSGPGTDATLMVNAAGTYSVTVTDANGCSGNTSVTVVENMVDPVDILGGPNFCAGTTLDLTATAGFAEYNWSNGINVETITINTQGTYSVTVTDANGCTNTASIDVVEIPDPMVDVTGDDLLCPGGSDMITLTATTGYTGYSWSNGGSTTNELVITDIGTYTVTVTDGNGCTNTASFEVSQDTPPDVVIDGNQTFCLGFSTTLTATAGYVNYNWSNGETTNAVTIDISGTYTVTVTDTDGCTNTAEITVNELTQLEPMINGELDICPGGAEDVELSLGGTYVTYTWGDGSADPTLTVNAAGTYSVTVTDSNGCSGNSSITIVENVVAPLDITGGPTFCQGSSLVLTASGGFEEYNWSSGDTNGTIILNTPGIYSVTATDANGCTNTAELEVIEIPDPVVEITGDDLLCPGGSDMITLTATSGYASYEWSNAGSTTNELVITQVGTYTVTITDDNGCNNTASFDVIEDTPPDVIIDGNENFCLGFDTDLSATAGYTSYEWSNGETTAGITVNISGTYTVTVTDEDGCTNTAEITVTELLQLEPMILGDLDICPGGAEQVDLSVDGTYVTYEWGDGTTNPTLTVNAAGSYTVTVTDENGCSGNTSVTIIENIIPPLDITGGDQYCEGSSLTVFASGGFDSYTWSTGDTGVSLSVDAPGVYSVTATDSNGCTNTASLDIIENPTPEPEITGDFEICEGEATTIDIGSWDAYEWGDGSTGQTLDITGPGTYTATITDANGCTGTASVDVIEYPNPEPQILGDLMFCLNGSTDLSIGGTYVGYEWTDGSTDPMVNVTDIGDFSVTVTDENGCTGTATVTIELQDMLYPTITGPDLVCVGSTVDLDAGVYDSYVWGDGSTQQTLTVSGAGTYEVTVTDEDGCSGVASYTLIEADPEPVNIDGNPWICDGSTSILTASGNNLVGFVWSNGENSFTNVISEPGIYSVTATDANGCTSTNEIEITLQLPPVATIIGDQLLCAGGEATIGVAETFVEYEWSTGETTQEIIVNTAGIYSVVVIDDFGCQTVLEFDLMEVPNPEPEITGQLIFCIDGFTEIFAEGWESVIWNTGETTESIIVDIEGDYTVTVTDINGCVGSSTVTVVEQEELMPTMTGEDFCDGETITVRVPGVYATYQWESGETTGAITVSESGTYAVTVTDAFGCSGNTSITVVEHPIPDIEIIGELEICSGESTLLTGPDDMQYYQWSPSGGGQTLEVTEQGTYSLTITDYNGCQNVASVFVNMHPETEPQILGDQYFCADYENELWLADDYVEYSWSTGETTPTIMYGGYDGVSVTVTDFNGCTGTDEFFTIQYETNPVEITGSTTFCIGGYSLLDAGEWITYEWIGPLDGNEQTLEAALPGYYTVYVTDYNGCTTSASIEIEQGTFLEPTIDDYFELCEGGSIILDAGTFDSYNWEGPITGTEQTLEVNLPGWYTLTVEDDLNCSGSVDIEVVQVAAPLPIINGTTSVCDGNPAVLSIGAFDQVLWSTGQTESSISVVSAGNYSVTVTDISGCTGASSVAVTTSDNPVIDISGDAIICPGTSSLLSVGNYDNYIWSTGETTQSITVSNEGIYGVTVTDNNGCSAFGELTVSIVNTDNLVIGGSTTICIGSSTTLDAGVQFSNWLWSTGETTQTIIVDQEGSYSVTVTDPSGCELTASTSISIETSLNISILGQTSICEGETTILDAGNFDSWVWTTPEGPFNTQTIEVSTPGIYSVVVDDGNGCSGSGDLTLAVGNIDPPTLTGLTTICDGESTTLAVEENYSSYQWSNGAQTQSTEISNAGSHSVTVTNAEGCSAVSSIDVIANQAPIATILGENTFCPGATVILDAGNFASYEWSVPGVSSQTLEIGSPGIISVTVTNDEGCQGIASIELFELEEEDINIIGSTTFCVGGFTTLEVDPNIGMITWSTGETTSSIEVDEPGTYTVSGVNEAGCNIQGNITITEDTSLSISIESDLTAICNDENTNLLLEGTYDVYEWSTGQTTSSISVDEPGVYAVTVYDASGCSGEDSIEITQGSVEVPNLLGDEYLCEGGQSIISIQQSYLSYEWSTGETNSSITVNNAGTYSVTVVSFDGCESTGAITVSESLNPEPTISGDEDICQGASTILTVDDFASYLWSIPGENGNSIMVEQPGTYTVTVTNDFGCQGSATFTVTELMPQTVEIGGSPTFCPGTSTFIAVDDSWQSVSWSTGETTNTIEIDQAGLYDVTVTDDNGCESIGTTQVSEDTDLYPTILGDPIICEGGATILDGGLGFGSWEWSNGLTGQFIEVTETGNYSVTVSDVSGQCTGVGEFTVDVAPTPMPEIQGPESLCPGELSNLIVLGSYDSFIWSTGETTQSIEINQGGDYEVIVLDENGCEGMSIITVVDEDGPFYELSSVDCEDGNSTYSVVLITDAINVSNNLDLNYEVIGDGEYLFSGIDTLFNLELNIGNGGIECQSIISVDAPNCGCQAMAIAGSNQSLSCEVNSVQIGDGSITIEDNFSYEWKDEEGNIIGEGATTMVSEAGVYTLVVTDLLNDCSDSDQVNVDNGDLPSINIFGEESICQDTETMLSADGDFSNYEWSTGENSAEIIVSESGEYSVTITDENGCTATSIHYLEVIETPAIGLVDYYCNEEETEYTAVFITQATTISVSGGYDYVEVGEYTYEISFIDINDVVSIQVEANGLSCMNTLEVQPPNCNCEAIADAGSPAYLDCDTESVVIGGPLTSNGSDFETSWFDAEGNLISNGLTVEVNEPGIYTLEVEDIVLGCSDIESVLVEDLSDMPVAVILSLTDNVIDCTISSVDLYVDPEDNILYSWQTAGGEMETTEINVTEGGEVILMAIDTISGCMSTDTFMIMDYSEYPLLEIESPDTLNCNIDEVALIATTEMLENELQVNWFDENGGLISEDELQIMVAEAGTYIIEVVDLVNGCQNSDTIEVLTNEFLPDLDLEEELYIPCDVTSVDVEFFISNDPNLERDYEIIWSDENGNFWSDAEWSGVVNYDGTYYVEVIDSQTGCSVQDSVLVTIDENKPYGFLSDVVDPYCSNENDGSINIADVNGGNAPYVFTLNGEESNFDGLFDGLGAGEHHLLVEDASGCVYDTVFVIEYDNLVSLDVNPKVLELVEGEVGQVLIETNLTGDYELLWDNTTGISCLDCLIPAVSPDTDQTYQITIYDEFGCSDTTTFRAVYDTDNNIGWPNIFTPGVGDVKNQKFTLFGDRNVKRIEDLRIFDRWGELMFFQEDFPPNTVYFGWDGTFQGQPVVNGVYVFIAHYSTISGEVVMVKGDITVVR